MKTKYNRPEQVQIDFLVRTSNCSKITAKTQLKNDGYDLIKAYRNLQQIRTDGKATN